MEYFSLHWTQEKRNSVSTQAHSFLCFKLKHHRPLLTRTFDKWPWFENGECFAILFINLTEWHKRQMTCQQLIGNKKTKQNRKTPKKVIIILHRCSCSFSKVTTVYINNRMQLSEKQLQVQSLPSTLHKLTKSPQSNLLVKHIKIDYGKIHNPSFIASWGYYEQTK